MRATPPLRDVPRSAALLVLFLRLALDPASGGAAQRPRIESTRQDDVVEIRASANLAADRDTAWRVLTDYGRYTAFIPNLGESRVVSRTGTSVTVEQSGKAVLGPLRIPIEITFQIHESPRDGIESRAIAGSLRSLESRYTLTVREQGIQLQYAGRIRPGFPLFGGLVQSAIEDNVARQFRALVDEIERQYRTGPVPSTEARR